jgi:imidazolonepropionase
LSYEEIAERGGGILNSARATAETSEEKLLEDAIQRAEEILTLGTTTVEIKSGYGLSVESELKLLRVANALKEHTPLRIKTTFLGAHAIPLAYASNRQGYIDLVCDVMLPKVVDAGLADFIDVFCDKGFFTPDETKYILEKGAKGGLPAKIHANELAISGGVQAGIASGAYSVDHLEFLGEEEISLLASSDTVACVLPTVAFFLGIPDAPSRKLADAGALLALASDYNPGSSPGGSMPFVMALACTRQRLLPEEALTASTLNAAYALRMSDELGALSPGRAADLIVCKPGLKLAHIPYYYAANPVERVMIDGVWVK